MKKALLFLLSFFLPVCLSAQYVVRYSYDTAGNRTDRAWGVARYEWSQGSERLFPVVSPPYIDSLAPVQVSYEVKIDPGHMPLVLTEEEKYAYNEAFFRNQGAQEQAWWEAYEKSGAQRSVNPISSVGAIPLQEGVSPTGAKTYSLPIPTAAGFKLVPAVSLGYNSQAAEGWAGYGWDIQGVPCIRLINKNEYYHGTIEAADVNDSYSSVFALDGIPLVTNAHSETSSNYPLETATGHILAKPVYVNNKIGRFLVLYPNGISAIFGLGTASDHTLVYYYLTEMQDLEGNKVTFSYVHDTDAGLDCLEAIRYGYDSADDYNAEISFSYTGQFYVPVRYFAGTQVRFTKRLTSIESRSGNEVLARYAFSYEQKGRFWLLNRIDCTSGSASLSPIEFTYPTTPSSQYLEADSRSRMLPSNFISPYVGTAYKRGKFMPYEFRDGLLIYPAWPTYSREWDFEAQDWVYGPFAPEHQHVLFIPRLTNNASYDSHLEFEEGFQSIDAVDVDGDGVDEIVKINLLEVIGTQTRVKITTYKSNDTGYLVWEGSFIVDLAGIHTADHTPYNRLFTWGDFNGDGRADLLAIAYSQDIPGDYGRSQTCYTAIIDIESQTVLSDEYLFHFSHSRTKCLIVNDIDNDGRAELCYATDNGFKIYRLQQNGHFVCESTLPGPDASVFSSVIRPCYFADFNGDGYLDIARAPESNSSYTWTIYYYTGNSFTSSSVPIAPLSSFTNAMFMDVNRDGLADFVAINKTSDTTATLSTRINENGFTFGSPQLSPDNIKNADGIVPVNVSAYNKPSAFMKIDSLYVYNYSYRGITGESRHIETVCDSYGKVLRNVYTYLPSMAPVWSDTSLTVNNAQGYAFQTLPVYVVTGDYASLGAYNAGLYKSNTYEYYNGVVHSRGLGFCGFSRIRTKEMVNAVHDYVHDVADVYYQPDKMGVVRKVVRKKGTAASSPAYYTQTNTWDNHSTTYGKLSPRLQSSTVTDALTGVTTHSYYTYDTWDYPLTARSVLSLSGSPEQRRRRTWSYQHSNSPSLYVLGSVTQEAVRQDVDGNVMRQWKEKTLTTYDSHFRPLSRQSYTGVSRSPAGNPDAESADSTLLVSETRWTYDGHGNVLTEKSAPYGATEFIGHTYTYDSDGRYLLTDTDALGHTTSYVGYNKFGKPYRVDDYRGRNTYYTFDAWGNVTSVYHPDGTMENASLSWGGTGVYTVTRTASGRPQTVTHYDGLGREVRTGEKRFDGQWRYVDRQYDRYGRLSRVSLPFRGTSASYWNTYTYDSYDRPTKIQEPSGRQTTWAYSGTSVTTVKEGISSVSTQDASGNVVSVSDAGGTITYTLRDDGQPSKVTAPGGVETTFSYDSYGRRTAIADPSAGTRTEAYAWNADGSHQQTHTGPNGSITTNWDKYGRTTSVQRSGMFITTYTYNSYGLLTAEQSTNGTGTEYTYDSYDRVSTVKENVPDSKWLRKTYTYGSGSIVSTVKYTTQDGDITTEIYSYANGHNTGIMLPDGTVVWSLVSENDPGAPTQVTTGTINRQYGYTDYGLPTYRKMAGGALQNYAYQFNASTGNLNYRTDNLNSQTETFLYDGLNRLEYMGSRQVGYAANGDILSMDGVGSMAYANASKPYQVTALNPASQSLVADRQQEITYNCMDLPVVLDESYRSAAFTYNGAGDRVKMLVTDYSTPVLTRYYIGGRYECDVTQTSTKERLYLGGDAYSAPMVLQRENNGSWTAYNIGRDYLGSITHIATSSGTLVAEYSYDPWGRLRNPQTHAIYTPGNEPELFLGRGFTGHEHLTWFGLINMNARLYDPLVGRFLSPDPYVQAPDFTQNFNRYSYALNNPLKYTDESGEFWGTILTALLRFPIAVTKGVIVPYFVSFFDSIKAENIFNQAWTEYAERVSNAFKIDMGLFKTGSALSTIENTLALLTGIMIWDAPNTLLGNAIAHLRNNSCIVTVEYSEGATLVNRAVSNKKRSGLSLGSYINGWNLSADPSSDDVFAHEYGHTIQSKILGPLYLPLVGPPSLLGCGLDKWNLNDHDREWYEVWANQLSYNYFERTGRTDITTDWSSDNPRVQHANWYLYPTLGYYIGLAIAAVFLVI